MQSRIKELEKIERIVIPEEEPVIHFTFPQPPPSGRTVVEVNHLSKDYGPKKVLENVSFTIDRGDRIALGGREWRWKINTHPDAFRARGANERIDQAGT